MVEIKQLPLGPLQTNCYFLGCETTRQAAIIDPAWNGQGLAQMVTEAEYSLTHILLTHAHFDHVGGLAALKAVTGAPIYAHAGTAAALTGSAQSARLFGMTIAEPPAVDVMLEEGDIVKVGDLRLEVLYTPGHAPGHVSFYLRDHDVVFDGDVLFQQSIGRTDLPGGNFEQLMQAIADKLLVLPDQTQVLSGHGAITTIGAERKHNPFLQ